MSACCASSSDGAIIDRAAEACPCCGAKGASVDPITLKALLTADGLRLGVPAAPRFCATPSCPVVYFDNAVPVRFDEELLTVRVHAKHRDDDSVPVCYCFGYTPRAIMITPTTTGHSDAFDDITREVKAGRCACDVRNPKGSCCLGDVATVETARALVAAVARQEETCPRGQEL